LPGVINQKRPRAAEYGNEGREDEQVNDSTFRFLRLAADEEVEHIAFDESVERDAETLHRGMPEVRFPTMRVACCVAGFSTEHERELDELAGSSLREDEVGDAE
jgi:hypothetical protein